MVAEPSQAQVDAAVSACNDLINELPFYQRGMISADMIYVDASHEEEDVYQDLGNFWEIASDNGLLFGDDYSWDGVKLAVERFAREEKRKVAFVADKWILRK